jgi:hypothetical protein
MERNMTDSWRQQPYLGLQNLVKGGIWYQKNHPEPKPVTGYALEVTTGEYIGTIYPIETVRYHDRGPAEVVCRSTKTASGKNYRKKVISINEYSGQGYKIIPYTGEAIIKKSEINFYDMFENKIKVGDWMFTENGLCQVTAISKTGITFDGGDKEHRRDWWNYAVLNDELTKNAGMLAVSKN